MSLIIDNLSGGASLEETSSWFAGSAKRIDQMPILHVDPALVEWGGAVSTALRQVAGVAKVGQTQINSRVAGVMQPGYTSDNYNGGYTDDKAFENARQQRRAGFAGTKSASAG